MGWDGAILLWIQNTLRTPALDDGVTFFTRLGNGGILLIALSTVFLCIPKTRRAGLVALTALLFSLICTNLILKPLVARPRPFDMIAGLIPLVEEASFSFPSGHTSAAFAFAGAMFFAPLAPRWGRWAALAAAVCFGLSRLYVGVHYPTDVLGGAAVGLLCSWAAAKRWNRKNHTL